jgi:hypothetical protein
LSGVTKGMMFDVFELVYIQDGRDKKTMENFIGKIKVKETRGPDFSLAVIFGNKMPFMKIAENSTDFIIKTTTERMR